MEIDVKRITLLAKLRIPDEKVESFTHDMRAIVKMVENLPEIPGNTALLDPDDTMSLRPDRARVGLSREAVLENAPQAVDGYFAVPRTVE